jgi:hypothetical protein
MGMQFVQSDFHLHIALVLPADRPTDQITSRSLQRAGTVQNAVTPIGMIRYDIFRARTRCVSYGRKQDSGRGTPLNDSFILRGYRHRISKQCCAPQIRRFYHLEIHKSAFSVILPNENVECHLSANPWPMSLMSTSRQSGEYVARQR